MALKFRNIKQIYRYKIIRLALPSLGENFLISMLMLTDTAIVGRLGGEALAVCGLSWGIFFFFLFLTFALNQGTLAVVSRYIGAKEKDKASRAAGQAILLNVMLNTIITIVIMLFADDLFVFMGASGVLKKQGPLFLRILSSTFILDGFTMASNASLRASGDTKTPMKVNGVINLFNIIIDYGLVFGVLFFPKLGVYGSAVATALVRFIGFFLSFGGLIMGWYRLKVSFKDIFPINKELMKKILLVGWPSLLENFIYSLASIAFVRIIASVGTLSIAVNNILFSAESLAFMPGLSFATAGGVTVGQSLGEKKPEKARLAGWEATKLGMAVMGFVGIIFFLFPQGVAKIFTNDKEVIILAGNVLRVIAPIEFVQGIMFVLRGVLQGAGDTKAVMKISALGVWLIRIPFAYIFALKAGCGIMGAWGAMALHIAVVTLFYLKRFRGNQWLKNDI